MYLKHTFLTAVLVLLSIAVSAFTKEQAEIDSLESQLEKITDNGSKVILLSELAYKYGLNDNEKAIKTAREAVTLSINGNSERAFMRSHYVLGRLFFEKGELDSAMILLSKVRSYYENKNDKVDLYNIYRDIAQIHQERKDLDQAKSYYQKSLELATEIDQPKKLGNAHNDLGSFYIQQYWKEKADSTYNEEYLSLAEGHLTKAQDYFLKANYKRGAGLCLGNLSLIAFEEGKYEKSLQDAQRAMGYFDELNEDIFKAIALTQVGRVYLKLGDLDEAERAAKECLIIGEKSDSKYELRDAYSILSEVSEKKGDYENAYKYYVLHNEAENEIINQQSQAKIEELEQEYQAVQREKEIAALNMDKAIQQEELNKQKLLLIFSFIFVGLFLTIILLLFRSYRQKKSDNLLLSEQKLKIEFQNRQLKSLNLKISDQNIKITDQNRQLQKLFDEHQNLLMMIVHDLQSPFNKIKGLSNILNLSVGLSLEQKEINDKIEEVAESGRALISDLINISYYEAAGTKANKKNVSVNKLIQKVHREHEPAAVKKKITLLYKDLAEDLKIITDEEFLARILDNLISNAIKYSPKRKKVFIVSSIENDQLKIEVQDQGPGISKGDQTKLFGKFQRLGARPTASESSTGLGLNIVKTLVHKLSGNITVESKLGEGSTFIIYLPLEVEYAAKI